MTRIGSTGAPQPPGNEPTGQKPSSGPLLSRAMLSAVFEWITSFSFVTASFSDWKAKKDYSTVIAKKMSDDVDKQKVLETHLCNLSMEQLKIIMQVVDQEPECSKWYIGKYLNNCPKEIPTLFANMSARPNLFAKAFDTARTKLAAQEEVDSENKPVFDHTPEGNAMFDTVRTTVIELWDQ